MRLERIRKAIEKGSKEERDRAVEELVEIEDPRAVNVLILGIERLPREARHRCFRRLCALGELGIGDKVPDRILKQVRTEIERKKSNVDLPFCTIGLDFLLPRKTKKALSLVEVLLSFPLDTAPVLDLLPGHSCEETVSFMADLASDGRPHRKRIRAAAVDRLGRWWSGPPLYVFRIPALLDALMLDREPALRALQGIAFPDFERPAMWKRWWKAREKLGGDLDILREDFNEEFRRVQAKALRERRKAEKKDLDNEAARAIASWTVRWSAPTFRWACPLLHELLEDKRCRTRRKSLAMTLGRIADSSSLAPLHALRETLLESDVKSKSLLRTVVDALGRAGASATEKERNETGKKLLPYLVGVHDDVIATAAQALGRLRYAEAEGPLLELVQAPKRNHVGCRAAEALGEIGATGTLEAMLEVFCEIVMVNKEPEVDLTLSLLKAFRTLDIRSPDMVDHLIDALKAENERTCLETIRLAGSAWKTVDAIDPLWQIFRGKERTLSLREAALEALASYPPGLTSDYLIEVLAMKFGVEERFGKEFHALVLDHFRRPDTLLPEHQRYLLLVIADGKANAAGRVACLGLLDGPGLWTHEKCVDPVAALLEGRDPRALAEAARRALMDHPSRAAMMRMVEGLPDSPNAPWALHHEWMFVVVDWYRILLGEFFTAPDHGRNGKKWQRWLKKNWKRVKALDDLGTGK